VSSCLHIRTWQNSFLFFLHCFFSWASVSIRLSISSNLCFSASHRCLRLRTSCTMTSFPRRESIHLCYIFTFVLPRHAASHISAHLFIITLSISPASSASSSPVPIQLHIQLMCFRPVYHHHPSSDLPSHSGRTTPVIRIASASFRVVTPLSDDPVAYIGCYVIMLCRPAAWVALGLGIDA
jgi:hypothetical protein